MPSATQAPICIEGPSLPNDNRFFLSKKALTNPENYLNQTIKAEFAKKNIEQPFTFSPPDFKEHGDL